MTILTELKAQGWHLSDEGLELCAGETANPSVSSIIQRALNMDLRDIGGNFLPEDLGKGKTDSLSGPGVLQIQKIKNASAPKYEYGSGAPPLLRLLLTDGNSYVNCLQWGQWRSISMETPPGTKLYLKPGKISMQNNFLLLREHQFTVLGGCVAAMVEKWELYKKLASHIRTKENLDGSGPPPWIPFGQKIVGAKPLKSGSNFRALDSDGKEAKEDEVFKQQRQANIAEISRMKEMKTKSFGGRKEKPIPAKSDSINSYSAQSNDYPSYENDAKKSVDSVPNSLGSPMKTRPGGANDRNKKGARNDYAQNRHENTRYQSFNNNNVSSSQYSSKDNKLENKYKLGDFLTQDLKQSSFSPKPSHSENTFVNTQPKQQQQQQHQYRQSYNSREYRSDDRQYQKNDPSQNLVGMMEQVKISGYDNQNSFVSSGICVKPGMEVRAKYWEDNQYYRAVIHAVGKEGKTCVVHFLDYGNYEEVLMDDVQVKNAPAERNWNAGPISFQPSSRNNYENYSGSHNQNYRDSAKPHQNFNKYNKSDAARGSRTEYRPSAKIYQPPGLRNPNS